MRLADQAGTSKRSLLPPFLFPPPLQYFLDPTRIKAALPRLWRSCRELEVEAEYLLLAEGVQQVHKVRPQAVGWPQAAAIVSERRLADALPALLRCAGRVRP